ncbi:hypothetical protein EVAR_47452_1 [Eumeta japonica]|uniref:Ig-like domain-containing protein n=1 Tax=Eumeta variegata TaxID=151549 RepID=A0A4C1XE62_EUMVA|nr:hypothetical protein EVAR_47452_1 [Eumeta japonica]
MQSWLGDSERSWCTMQEIVQRNKCLWTAGRAAPRLLTVVEEPEFTDVIENVTVPAGRSVRLACSVKNLGSYKVRMRTFLYIISDPHIISLMIITPENSTHDRMRQKMME